MPSKEEIERKILEEHDRQILEENESKVFSEREKLIQEREKQFAIFLQTIKNFQEKEVIKLLESKLNELHDSVIQVDMNNGIAATKADRRMRGFYWHMANVLKTKHIRTMIFVFLAGIILTLIPTFFYISTLKKESVIPFHYTPNNIAYRKPLYLQILQTQKEVDEAKKTGIYLSDQLTIGDGIGVTTKGLSVYLKREFDDPTVHMVSVSPVNKARVTIGGYTFIPNAILNSDPGEIQILTNQTEVDSAKADKEMTYKSDIEVGGGIVCIENVPCYGIPKSDITERMTLKALEPSHPEEQKQ